MDIGSILGTIEDSPRIHWFYRDKKIYCELDRGVIARIYPVH